ncbi:hypothetical protein Q7P35_011627 [Cladosporium inversicolor]
MDHASHMVEPRVSWRSPVKRCKTQHGRSRSFPRDDGEVNGIGVGNKNAVEYAWAISAPSMGTCKTTPTRLHPRPTPIGISITNDVRGSNTIPTGVLSRCRGESWRLARTPPLIPTDLDQNQGAGGRASGGGSVEEQSRAGSSTVPGGGTEHHSSIIMHMHAETTAPPHVLVARGKWYLRGVDVGTRSSFFSIRPLPRLQSYLTFLPYTTPAIEEAAAAATSFPQTHTTLACLYLDPPPLPLA